MSAKSSVNALRNIKSQSGVKLNKIEDAVNRGDLADAFKYIEQHRGLNTRLAYELTQLSKRLKVD